MSWRGYSHWRENRLDYWSEYIHVRMHTRLILQHHLMCVCVSVCRNLRKTESRKTKLEEQLNSVGQKVNELKEKFQSRTTEAAKLEAEVSKAQETIQAAEQLIHQLDGEHTRWNAQVDEITEELDTLPRRAMLAAAFITYLSAAPEDRRRNSLETWMMASGLQSKTLKHTHRHTQTHTDTHRHTQTHTDTQTHTYTQP
uniref:Dynein heavy chain coiled coil stalk domain-containing protein n=1 Tax=Hucho hucho TaxID=62062 RepID=A0A4W5MTR9_9TELE